MLSAACQLCIPKSVMWVWLPCDAGALGKPRQEETRTYSSETLCFVCVYVLVSAYVCMFACMCKCVCVRVHTCMCVRVFICVSTCVCMHVGVCVCLHRSTLTPGVALRYPPQLITHYIITNLHCYCMYMVVSLHVRVYTTHV